MVQSNSSRRCSSSIFRFINRASMAPRGALLLLLTICSIITVVTGATDSHQAQHPRSVDKLLDIDENSHALDSGPWHTSSGTPVGDNTAHGLPMHQQTEASYLHVDYRENEGDRIQSGMRQALAETEQAEMSAEDRIKRLRADFERNKRSWEYSDKVVNKTSTNPVAKRIDSWIQDAEIPVEYPDLDKMIEDAGVTKERPFLFIGVLSSRRTYRRRLTVRNTWQRFVTHMPTTMVDIKFVLSTDEIYEGSGEQVDDVLYVNEEVTYSSILIKVFVMMDHAVKTGARWVLKTDDDAYVNVPQTVQNLLKLCSTKECDKEAKYVGTFIGGAPVFMDAKHKWHNHAYIMHASVKNYLPYALGGGYILSFDIIKVLVALHHKVSLTFTPIEDATVGMWVAPLNITRINWEGVMLTAGWTCCFTRSTARDDRNDVLGRYSLSADPCKPARAERKIHMGASIQQLLERSAQAQSEEVGHTLSLSVEEDENDTETDSDGGDLDSSSSDSAGSTSGAGGDTVATGDGNPELNTLRGGTTSVDEADTAAHTDPALHHSTAGQTTDLTVTNEDLTLGGVGASAQDQSVTNEDLALNTLGESTQVHTVNSEDLTMNSMGDSVMTGSVMADSTEVHTVNSVATATDLAVGNEGLIVHTAKSVDSLGESTEVHTVNGADSATEEEAGEGAVVVINSEQQATLQDRQTEHPQDAALADEQQQRLRALLAGLGEVSVLRGARNLANSNSGSSSDIDHPLLQALQQQTQQQQLQQQPGVQTTSEDTEMMTTLDLLKAQTALARSIAAEDDLATEADTTWRTRPMVMHKVANPLHMYYLHWRLQHCAIPKQDLLTPEAIALAQGSMPSTRVIFRPVASVDNRFAGNVSAPRLTGGNLNDTETIISSIAASIAAGSGGQGGQESEGTED